MCKIVVISYREVKQATIHNIKAKKYNITKYKLYTSTNPPYLHSKMLSRGSTQNTFNHSNSTSTSEGHNLGEVEYVWKELAASEMRLNLMENLQHYQVGFNDVEFFNLGLHFNEKDKL